jgi:hypothetical protein
MELSPDQVRAARAAGCTFIAATADQVARLTMQRRIFMIDGVAHLVRRAASGFYETQGTLAPLIAGAPPPPLETPQEAAEADASTAREMAAEGSSQRAGGAKVMRRTPGRPRGPRIA